MGRRRKLRLWRDRLEHRLLARRRGRLPGRILLAWWGVLPDGQPTAGDFLAVTNLARSLNAASPLADLASAHPVPDALLTGSGDGGEPASCCISPDAVRPDDYRVLAFVCGPLVDEWKLLDFLARFSAQARLAVGVGLLPNQPRMPSMFDEVLAREGGGGDSFDLALAGAPADPVPEPGRAAPIAVCLRGAQNEYGRGRCASKQAETAIAQACGRLAAQRFEIDTRVEVRSNPLSEVLDGFGRARVVLTTRLHGSLLALRAGRPFVAVDQIRGGAKVREVLGALGWPFVLGVEEASAERIVEMAEQALSPAFASRLQVLRREAIARSDAALETARARILAAAGTAGS